MGNFDKIYNPNQEKMLSEEDIKGLITVISEQEDKDILQDAIKTLITVRKENPNYVKGEDIAKVLINIGDAGAIAKLVNYRKGEDYAWIIEIIDYCKRNNPRILETTVESIITLLNSDETILRVTAAKILGFMGMPRASEPLFVAIEDDDVQVRDAVISALSRIDSDALIKFLSDKSDVRALNKILINHYTGKEGLYKVIYSLVNINTKEAYESLELFLDKCQKMEQDKWGEIGVNVMPHSGVYTDEQRAVCMALSTYKGRETPPERDDLLIKALKSHQTCSEAARTISDLCFVKKESFAPGVVDALINALSAGRAPAQRWESAAALGWIEDKRAVEPLKNALNDEWPKVRFAATKALEMINANTSAHVNNEPDNMRHKIVADSSFKKSEGYERVAKKPWWRFW